MTTIHQVDPIALRKKLARLGIGPKFQFSQTAAMDAARDFGNQHSQEAEDAVETVVGIASIAPGTCVLEPAEIAYMIHAWAMLWEVPA